MTALGELVLIGLVVALAEVLEVLEGARRFAVVCADNAVVLPMLPDGAVGHTISDPPYSEEFTHGKARIGNRLPDRHKRDEGLGFGSITPDEMSAFGGEVSRLTLRWALVFSDAELAADWRAVLVGAGLDYVRLCAWVKLACSPQFSGDRPAAGFEAITVAHQPGRKRWNGGGTRGVWSYPIETKDRAHTTQKPLDLMLELVELFTDPDEVVLDPFAGSGTTGVACLRLGRRCILIERDAKYAAVARERLGAESSGLTLRAARAGQIPLFGSAS